MTSKEKISPVTFYGLGIAPKLLDILSQLKFTHPTPIQERAIPVAIEGKDVIGIAQTGTGKTLAFGIPMIQRIAQNKGLGLVVLPTRELAHQVNETLQRVGKQLGLKTALIIGGASMRMQAQAIKKNPHVVIGTPGRIIDHLDQKTLRFERVSVLVLDEADRMLDMGFAPQIKRILKEIPRTRQTLLFSATMPDDIVRLATLHMRLPFRIEIARPGTAAEHIEQELFVVKKENKQALLKTILTQYRGSVLVFMRTKHGSRKLNRAIQEMGFSSGELHSGRSLPQRRQALAGFKSGKYRVLVATDIASRGIDVKGIELVVNYDIPDKPEDYVHRIGRTGRAGMKGHAISFATPDQKNAVRDIERLLQTAIVVSKTHPFPTASRKDHIPGPDKRHNHYKKSYHRSPKRHFFRKSSA